MSTILTKLINRQPITEDDIQSEVRPIYLQVARGQAVPDSEITTELYEICDQEHASCNPNCPVYAKNGNKTLEPDDESDNCRAFKRGDIMLDFLRAN